MATGSQVKVAGCALFAFETDGIGLGLSVIVPEGWGLVGAELARGAVLVADADRVGRALVFAVDGVELADVGEALLVLAGREVDAVGVAARAAVPVAVLATASPSARIRSVR